MASRRDVLTGFGGIFSLSGCAGENETGSTSSATPTVTDTPTETDTQTATRTSPPTATATSTQTDVPTPDPYTRKLNEVERKLLEEMSEFTRGRDIDNLPFEISAPNPRDSSRLFDTRGELNDINQSQLSDEQKGRLSRLWDAFWFVWWTETLHNDVSNVLDSASKSWDNERGTKGTNESVEPLEDAYSTASDSFDRLKEYSSRSGIAELEGFTEDDFGLAVDRYSIPISQAQTLIEKIGLHQVANLEWHQENYQEAEEKYRNNADSYAEPNWSDHFQPIVDEMICYAETMVERSQAFLRAQKLEEKGEPNDAEVERDLAPDPAEECSFESAELTPTSEESIAQWVGLLRG